jgi:transposase, IS5 family
MKRATSGHPLNDIDKLRNSLISKLRSPGERPYSVIKRVFRAGHVLVTTVQRVHVKWYLLLSLSTYASSVH